MKIKIIFLFLFLIAFNLFSENIIYKINIDGVIDNGLTPYVARAINIAKEEKASFIIFDINTFGGRVDAAVAIKDLILDTEIKTIAYVNNRAISAGALIALSCDILIMNEGSSMGAASVVDQSGNKMSEKAQSYMRAEIASTAERNGKDKNIAKAMVDEDIEIENIIEKGKLLTLTSSEAFNINYCDTIISSYEKIYDYLGLENPVVKTIEVSFGENLVRFFTNPIVSSLLITLGTLGIFFELQNPGWGISGTFGIICMALFFGSHHIIDLAGSFELILFGVGVLLILLEVFVIPGFGIAGISGILSVIASFMFTLLDNYPTKEDILSAGTVISISFFLIILFSLIFLKLLFKVNLFEGLINHEAIQKRFYPLKGDDLSLLVGKDGIAVTDLRLSGRIRIEDREYQAISKNEYINRDDKIKVDKIEGNKIIIIKQN